MRIRVNQTSNGHASRYERDVAEHLDEGVLDGFVGLGGVAQVLIGDARRPALMLPDEPGEPLARLVHLAALDQAADFDRQRAYRPKAAPDAAARPRPRAAPWKRRRCRRRLERLRITTHRGITIRFGRCLQFNV